MYTRCYLCRVGATVTTGVEYITENLNDFLFIYNTVICRNIHLLTKCLLCLTQNSSIVVTDCLRRYKSQLIKSEYWYGGIYSVIHTSNKFYNGNHFNSGVKQSFRWNLFKMPGEKEQVCYFWIHKYFISTIAFVMRITVLLTVQK